MYCIFFFFLISSQNSGGEHADMPLSSVPIRPYEFADDDRFRNLDTLAKVESAWDAIFPREQSSYCYFFFLFFSLQGISTFR